jgi:hypothetical protein
MLKGKAQWRNSGSKLAGDIDLLRHLQRQYSEKDVLREELAQSKRSLSDLRGRYNTDLTIMHNAFDKATIQNSELRRQQGSGSKMADYEREEMVKMMETGAVERGQLEAEVESLKARVRKLETEAELHKLQNKAPAGDMPLGKAEWRETYKSLARLLHPDKNDWPSADDPRTTAFRVAAELNEFYNK